MPQIIGLAIAVVVITSIAALLLLRCLELQRLNSALLETVKLQGQLVLKMEKRSRWLLSELGGEPQRQKER